MDQYMAAQEHNTSQGGTMAHNASSDSDNEITTTRAKLFDHEIHEVLGGGKGTIEFNGHGLLVVLCYI